MKPIITLFCFLLLVCPGFADDKSLGDVKPIELLKKFDSQAMWDPYVGKRHQARVDARMAKHRMTSKKADHSLSYLKILEYILHNEKPEK